MSVSLRVTGTWAELTADGSVAIPATPQAGDRMYLFARWKDFSITATVANWTELTEFADGSVSSGNGTGSVKVGCWYRDWQAGDTDPTIDFSASPTTASVVIMVMQKEATDAWDTPVARTAAMTNWTTTSQSVSASATVDVRSGGVVMGLIGLRDDSATMTRPTNGIDDSGGLVTWNGNYVESPATHHSTTTGDDGAADLGYRLVTTGAAGATLRLTGTISAAETGAALWVVQGVNTSLTPGNTSLATSFFAPRLQLTLTPVTASLTDTQFAPQLRLIVTPNTATLSIATLAPIFGVGLTPSATSLTTTGFAPTLNLQVVPATAMVGLNTFPASLHESVTPASSALNLTTLSPVLGVGFVPATASLALGAFAPSVTQNVILIIPNASLSLATSKSHILPFRLVFLDPGGDATRSVGSFNLDVSETGLISFDGTQQVHGAGSWKFDSDTGVQVPAAVNGVLDNTRRVSMYFRYDSQPDATEAVSEFFEDNSIYSGGGFNSPANMHGDEGAYATATPAQNAGQGNKCSPVSPLDVSIGGVIDSVKIIYERKYDTDTSIGISRVKWVVNGEEGPNYDNTSMPLTDTVVEVDITADRAWGWEDFQSGGFEIVAEARRGDTATEHTQSWDFLKAEVTFHLPATIMAGLTNSNVVIFRIAIRPKDTGAVVRFVDGAGTSYDGITFLAVNTFNRVSFAFIYHGVDNLDIKVFVNGIEELSITEASSGGLSKPVNFQYGWLLNPGADHLAWFNQIYIDDGDDLTDCGNMLSTAKLPATVNENNWDITGGTGAVDERPLSETNYIMQSAFSSVRQTYTLQTAATGDVDISGETLVGYMGWAWAKRESGSVERIGLIVNNVDVSRSTVITTSPSLLRAAATSASYPSDAAGIGMSSNSEDAGVFMYEAGAIVAYEGPANPDILLERQEIANETLDTIVDDLRADPPGSYEICCNVVEFDGEVQIVVSSLDQEGGSFQEQGTLFSSGGVQRRRITPGIEVRLDVTVVGATMVQVYRRINFE